MCTVESINVFLVITLFAFGWVESLALNPALCRWVRVSRRPSDSVSTVLYGGEMESERGSPHLFNQ